MALNNLFDVQYFVYLVTGGWDVALPSSLYVLPSYFASPCVRLSWNWVDMQGYPEPLSIGVYNYGRKIRYGLNFTRGHWLAKYWRNEHDPNLHREEARCYFDPDDIPWRYRADPELEIEYLKERMAISVQNLMGGDFSGF